MSTQTTGRTPSLAAPRGTCDCHIHVFDPRFPLAADLAYTPDESSIESYNIIRKRLGIDRTIVVQPSAYGADNRCTLEAVSKLAPNARGIAVVDSSISDKQLEYFHKAGIRGLRFSFTVKNAMSPDLLELMASRIQPLGWHIQLRSTHKDLPILASRLKKLPVDVCLDHFGGIPPEEPISNMVWQSLFCLLDKGNCWVKISAPYQLSHMPGPGYSDYADKVSRLVEIAPEHLLWGTNWPHPMTTVSTIKKPDDADLLDSLAEWISDDSIRKAILVDNPAKLYGF